MRRTGSRPRSVLVFVLLTFSATTLSTTSARAEPPPPKPSPAQPIELREVFWSGRYGQMRHAERPFQGNRLLEGPDLYRALGREDLARAYESRGHAKIALAIAGLGALVLGAIVTASATPETRCDTPPRNVIQPPVCRTDEKQGTVAAGIGMALLGPTLMLVAGFGVAAEPVAPAERQRLIDAFNASLAPAAAAGAPTRPRPAAIRFTASPTLSGSGAGVTLDARF